MFKTLFWRWGRNCHQEIEADLKSQESNFLGVKENNREGFRFFFYPVKSDFIRLRIFRIDVDLSKVRYLPSIRMSLTKRGLVVLDMKCSL